MKVFVKQYTYPVSETGLKTQPINQWCEIKKLVLLEDDIDDIKIRIWYVITTGEYTGFRIFREEFLTIQQMRKQKIQKLNKI